MADEPTGKTSRLILPTDDRLDEDEVFDVIDGTAGALSCPGHGESVPNATLFEGVAGAAYAALRFREPGALPCVLLLE